MGQLPHTLIATENSDLILNLPMAVLLYPELVDKGPRFSQ